VQKLLAEAEAAIATAASAAMEAERAAADAVIAKEEAEHARRLAYCFWTVDCICDGMGVSAAVPDTAAGASAMLDHGRT